MPLASRALAIPRRPGNNAHVPPRESFVRLALPDQSACAHPQRYPIHPCTLLPESTLVPRRLMELSRHVRPWLRVGVRVDRGEVVRLRNSGYSVLREVWVTVLKGARQACPFSAKNLALVCSWETITGSWAPGYCQGEPATSLNGVQASISDR